MFLPLEHEKRALSEKFLQSELTPQYSNAGSLSPDQVIKSFQKFAEQNSINTLTLYEVWSYAAYLAAEIDRQYGENGRRLTTFVNVLAQVNDIGESPRSIHLDSAAD
jgi:hypothetical protein